MNTLIVFGIMFLVAFTGMFFAENVKAGIVYVDDSGGADYTRIQDAIDNASADDTIYVFSGIYYENVNINKYGINLIGEEKNTTIIDSALTGNGIEINENHILVSSFTIRNAGNYGVNFNNGRDWNTLKNCIIHDSLSDGIYLRGDKLDTIHNTIENCIIFDNGGCGVEFSLANHGGSSIQYNRIINSTIYSNDDCGIRISGGGSRNMNHITISGCICYDNLNCGIYIVSGDFSNSIIVNTVCYNNSQDGLYMESVEHNTVSNFVSYNNSDCGLEIRYSNNQNFIDCSLYNNDNYGLWYFTLNNFEIRNSIIQNNKDGVLVDTSYNGDIFNCSTNVNNWSGIILDSSYDIIVENCTTNDNYNGINIVDNDAYDNTIRNNTVVNNTNYGVHTILSDDNLIYNNYLDNDNNSFELLPGTGNIWNISKVAGTNIIGGPYLGGNYWSDFDESIEGAFDADSDGIVDSPYTILEGGSMDYYPLMPYTPPGPTLWSAVLNFNESSGLSDYVIFGEDPDASDGQDEYDVPSPPDPDIPYLNAWFDAGLSAPYNKLIEDYRFYPDNSKIWDLYLIFNNSLPISSDTIMITWDVADFVNSEYYSGSILLENPALAETVDMKAQFAYNFDASLDTLYHLFVNCTLNLPPVANFTYEPVYPTSNDVVFFNDTSYDLDGYIVNWSWSFGDGDISYDQNTTHTYSHGGLYTVTLTVTDSDGTTDSIAKTITIYDSIQLQNGWNLISAPSGVPIDKSQIIIRYNNIYYTWSDAVTAGIILDYFYGWNKTTQLYTLNYSLDPGHGYWTWAHYDCEMLLSHNPSTGYYITSLRYRWNLIGLPSTQPIYKELLYVHYNGVNYTWQEATSNSNSEGEPLILEFVYTWNRSVQTYELTDTLIPGYGHWMYAYYNCSLIRSTPPTTLQSNIHHDEKEINLFNNERKTQSIDSWNIRLDISEPGGAVDYVTLAEKFDALDGIDSYDVPKCPSGISPYIRAWFKSEQSTPFDKLWMDYKKYPGNEKEWSLNIQWVPEDFESSTEITIRWDNTGLENIEYESMVLYDVEKGEVVSDITQDTQYTFTISALEVNKFKIKCIQGDIIPPDLQLIKPEKGLYLFNKKIIPLLTCIIFGDINIDVTASDEYGIDRIEFYIDNVLKNTDDTIPYSWSWNDFSFGRHSLKVIVYDNAGNTKYVDSKVWKFF